MYAQQPAVVAPVLAQENNAPVPTVEQNAQTGPEMVGADDPRTDRLGKKPGFLGRIANKLKP